MMQRGVPLRSVDDARLADGDVTDTQGRVLYRATPLRWVWCALILWGVVLFLTAWEER